MIKNRKLISLVAAIAMVFTMLSSFTIASAVTSSEISQGITLSCVEAEDGLSATVTVGYKGIEGGVETAGIQINGVPSVTTAIEATETLAATESLSTDNIADGYFVYGNSAVNNTATDGTIKSFKLTFSEPLAKNATLSLANNTMTYLTNASAAYSTLDNAAEAGMTKIEAVTQNVTAVKAPKQAEVDQPAEDTSAAPAALPDVKTIEQGLTLKVDKSSDTEYIITVGYKGITGGVETCGIQVNGIPTNATSVEATETLAATESLSTDNLADGYFIYGNSAVNNTATDGTIKSFKLTLPGALSNDVQISLAKNTMTYLTNASAAYSTLDNAAEAGMTKIESANANLVAPEKTGGTEVAIPVDSDKVTGETVDTTGGKKTSDYYIVSKVVDGEGNEVAYGQDADGNDTYVAEVVYTDANGDEQKVTLTEGQYKNLMSGHLGADNVKDLAEKAGINSMADVVDKVKLVMYNNNLKVNAQLVQATDDGNLVKDEGEGSAKPSQGDSYVASTAKLGKNKSQTATLGKEVTNTFTITPGSKNGEKYAYGDATFQLDAASLKLLTLAGVEISFNELKVADEATTATSPVTVTTADEITLPKTADGKYTIKFTAGATGKVTYKVTYAGKDNTGADKTFEDTVTYTVSEAKSSTNGGSSSSSKDNTSSGGGAIASGLVDSGSSYLPNLGFDDLGDVTWAQTAINTLAAKKIVSGVGDNKFDPNAALTRAAYAQMLVNAIGHSTDSADTYFDDVPTDAWFYHNVAVASQLGIVSGFGDGTFRPNDLITREQMALMTQKAAVVMGKSLVGADVGTFTDDADIADWSRDAVYTLANAGIINGMGDGTFAPQANATRAQAAVIIYNAFVK